MIHTFTRWANVQPMTLADLALALPIAAYILAVTQ